MEMMMGERDQSQDKWGKFMWDEGEGWGGDEGWEELTWRSNGNSESTQELWSRMGSDGATGHKDNRPNGRCTSTESFQNHPSHIKHAIVMSVLCMCACAQRVKRPTTHNICYHTHTT